VGHKEPGILSIENTCEWLLHSFEIGGEATFTVDGSNEKYSSFCSAKGCIQKALIPFP